MRAIVPLPQALARALELTAPIARNPQRILPAVIEDRVAELGDAPALISSGECLTYRTLAERSNRYARWALDQGLAKGEAVALIMPNRPEYMATWLGISSVGGVVALINTNLSGPGLAHCIDIARPKHVIVAAEFIDEWNTALPHIASRPMVWVHGASHAKFQRIDRAIEQFAGERLSGAERRPLTIEDRALYIYTSGTTGLPKAANISHGRVMQWSHWFAGLMMARPTDRMYDCLPMYHSVGGVQAPGAILAVGGSVVIRERFSASQFWQDVVRWDCTLFQYIGELCRYLLHTESSADEARHRIRMACGNGLRPDVWAQFKDRFQIPQILEFYGATEGAVSLFNVEDAPNSIGRIPPFLAHRFAVKLVRFDVENEEPFRNAAGFCIPCLPNEVGEAIGQLRPDKLNVGNRFEGYTDGAASESKIFRNVFEIGDRWFRTGDLMRRDERGFFYFVDRIGDTFRWKGENVAASEVSEVLSAFPGISHAIVYGVAVPASDGRAGMAAIVAEDNLDLTALHAYLTSRLPSYARPVFLRIRCALEVTSTFKYTKAEFVRQGYDPDATPDALYWNHPEQAAFVRLDRALYKRIAQCQEAAAR